MATLAATAASSRPSTSPATLAGVLTLTNPRPIAAPSTPTPSQHRAIRSTTTRSLGGVFDWSESLDAPRSSTGMTGIMACRRADSQPFGRCLDSITGAPSDALIGQRETPRRPGPRVTVPAVVRILSEWLAGLGLRASNDTAGRRLLRRRRATRPASITVVHGYHR